MAGFSFINNGLYTITKYYKNENKGWEIEYKDGKQNGKSIGWYRNGNKCWETEYKDDKQHGKDIGWYEDGNKRYEIDYKNDKRHCKYISWYKNGKKYCEDYYWEDKQVSEQKYLSLSNPSENCGGKVVEIDGKKYILKLED